MNTKKAWSIVPAAALPYLALFALAVIFLSTTNSFFHLVMEKVFGGNALLLIAALLLCCVAVLTYSIVCFVISIRKGWNALSLAKSAMILKLIQVPAYVMIFAMGVLFAITLFTIPFAVGLLLLDCLTLFLSGLFTVAACVNAVRQGDFKSKEVLWIVILQLFFCADVVASVVFYLRSKKRKKAL